MDKYSYADYLNAAAIIIIKESEGPNMLDDIDYGRKDAKSIGKGSINAVPNMQNFKDVLEAKGFSNEEIVALSYIPAFGVV